MLDVRKLKAQMTLYGYTNESISKELGITSKTFSRRLKTRDFGTKEMEILIDRLHIDNPVEIFFASE